MIKQSPLVLLIFLMAGLFFSSLVILTDEYQGWRDWRSCCARCESLATNAQRPTRPKLKREYDLCRCNTDDDLYIVLH